MTEKKYDRNKHHDHQKRSAATRVLTLLDRRVIDIQVEAFFPSENGLMLGTVIFEHAADVLQIRHRKDHDDEEDHPNKPQINQVK